MALGWLRAQASGLAPAYRPAPVAKPVRHHWSTLVLTLAYIVLLILPWVATCVLNAQPTLTGESSYTATPADDLTDGQQSVLIWMYAIKIMTALGAALAIPLVSAVLAHAAVALVQRRQTEEAIQLRHFLNLSDGSWMRVPGTERSQSKLVMAATALVLLSMIIPPVQFALVSFETVQVATCADVPYTYPLDLPDKCESMSLNHPSFSVVGYDPEPADMAKAPTVIVLQRVAKNLATTYLYDRQPNAWAETWDSQERGRDSAVGSFSGYYGSSEGLGSLKAPASTSVPYFAAALPVGTTTGVLREHALRMNSTVSCEVVSAGTYPTVCPGDKPFTGTYSVSSLTIRFCLPGDYTVVPWSKLRDMNTIVENFYIDIKLRDTSALPLLDDDSDYVDTTVSCVATSSRGYFELPNIRNDNTPGPLLETWPTRQALEGQFTDYTAAGSLLSNQSVSEGQTVWFTSDPYTEDEHGPPGPLSISVMAMLGNASSWFPTAVSAANSTDATVQLDALYSICDHQIPLGYLGASTEDGESDSYGFSDVSTTCASFDPGAWEWSNTTAQDIITEIVYQWFTSFSEPLYNELDEIQGPPAGNEGLGIAMYFANEALLTATAAAGSCYLCGSREIFTSPGTQVMRPGVSLAALIVVSCLLGIEVLALSALLFFIYGVPTIGSRFDAATLLVIGARLKDALEASMPRLGLVDEKALARLEHIDVREAFLLDGGLDIELQDVPARSDATPVSSVARRSEDTIVDPDARVGRRDGY